MGDILLGTQISVALVSLLLAVSEILGSFDRFKSNSVFQLLKGLILDLFKKLVLKKEEEEEEES